MSDANHISFRVAMDDNDQLTAPPRMIRVIKAKDLLRGGDTSRSERSILATLIKNPEPTLSDISLIALLIERNPERSKEFLKRLRDSMVWD